MDVTFTATLVEWRGPAPFYWFPLPDEAADYVAAQASVATYGWGAIPVRVRIGATEWETSLLPKEGTYFLGVKKMVRDREGFDEGDTVEVGMSIEQRNGRAANGTGSAK